MSIWTRKKSKDPLLILSPMAGYTDSAFRELCRSFGADITISELISADNIYHNKRIKKYGSRSMDKELVDSDKTLQMLQFSESERPFVIQLFGKFPEKFAYAARWVEENLKPDGIDINMGCPAKKMVGSDHGAALLKDHKLAVDIVTTVKENISLPLTVKTRLGWESDDEILKLAPKLIEAGVDALIIHGRTYKDGFKNKARWGNIHKIKQYTVNGKQEVSIIGNGDIGSYDDVTKKVKKLDGVAIGRATFGRPWIFQKVKSQKSKVKIKEIILRHAKLVYDRKGDHGIIEFRKHLLVYLKNFNGAKHLRTQTVNIKTISDVQNIVSEIN